MKSILLFIILSKLYFCSSGAAAADPRHAVRGHHRHHPGVAAPAEDQGLKVSGKYFCSNDTDNLPPDCGGSCRRRGRIASCGGSTTRSSPTTTRRSCTGTDKILSGSQNIFTVKIFIPSTGKGISHTLARRAAFFLSQGEHSLAVRDLNIALEYGGQGVCDVLSVLLLYCE